MRPKLRSMKRSGSPTGCDTNDVLEVCYLDSELLRHILEVFPGPEPLKRVGDTSAAVTEDGLTKGARRVSHNVGPTVLWQVNEPCIPIWGVLDAMQVILHHLGEDSLAVPYHHEIAGATGLRTVTDCLGVVVENLRPVGVQGSRGKCMLEPDIVGQNLQRWTDSLEWNTSLTNGRKNHALNQTNERDD